MNYVPIPHTSLWIDRQQGIHIASPKQPKFHTRVTAKQHPKMHAQLLKIILAGQKGPRK
jgi:hypothetical protein